MIAFGERNLLNKSALPTSKPLPNQEIMGQNIIPKTIPNAGDINFERYS